MLPHQLLVGGNVGEGSDDTVDIEIWRPFGLDLNR
jgi:hypothetical protein